MFSNVIDSAMTKFVTKFGIYFFICHSTSLIKEIIKNEDNIDGKTKIFGAFFVHHCMIPDEMFKAFSRITVEKLGDIVSLYLAPLSNGTTLLFSCNCTGHGYHNGNFNHGDQQQQSQTE